MAWQKGPMPPGTYNWGGVVTKELAGKSGFYFADFRGDHVVLCPDTNGTPKRVEAADILWFDNSLTLPPTE